MTARTRTPSEVKWLANVRAATQGEIDRIDEQIARLTARKAQLLTERDALTCVADQLAVPDITALAPPVRPHGDYGGRGELIKFLHATIESAYPQAVDTLTLAKVAMRHFGLSFPNTIEQRRWVHGSLGRALNKLKERGDVERLRHPGAGNATPTAWKHSVNTASLEDLRRLDAAANPRGASWP
jgi:hypothetical protein